MLLTPTGLGTIELNPHLHQFQVHKQILPGTGRHHQQFQILQGQVVGTCLANSPASPSACSSILPLKQTPHPLLVLLTRKFQLECSLSSSSSQHKSQVHSSIACSLRELRGKLKCYTSSTEEKHVLSLPEDVILVDYVVATLFFPMNSRISKTLSTIKQKGKKRKTLAEPFATGG